MEIRTCKEIYENLRKSYLDYEEEKQYNPKRKISEEKIRGVISSIINNYYKNYNQNNHEITNEIKLDEESIYEVLKDNYFIVFDEIKLNLKKFGVEKDYEFIEYALKEFEKFIKEIFVTPNKCRYCTESLKHTKEILELEISNTNDMDELIDIFEKNRSHISGQYLWHTLKYMDIVESIYISLIPEELRSNPEFIKKVIKKVYKSTGFIMKYVKDEDSSKIIDYAYENIFGDIKEALSEEETKYIINIYKKYGGEYVPYDLFDKEVLYVMCKQKYNLVNKLRKKYGKSYNEFALKNGIDPEDNEKFMLAMLKSNVLKDIYIKDDFNIQDANDVNSIITAFEIDKVDCKDIRTAQKNIIKELSNREIEMCNYIFKNKDNEEAINKLLEQLNIDKDNFFTYIKNRKFLDKELKKSVLMILSNRFKCNYISVFDIIDFLQEMNERELTIDQILDEKQLDRKIFYDYYEKVKLDNPALFKLIKDYLANNKIRGFKKLLKLYYSIINSNYTNSNGFIAKYGISPEEMIAYFKNTPFKDQINLKLLPLCGKIVDNDTQNKKI